MTGREPDKKRRPHVPTQRHAIALNQGKKISSTRARYSSKRDSICAFQRDKYALEQ